jgi:hypothetical protein
MSEPVHVFIASTTGLVSIDAIAHRNGQSLASFVTIAGGSKVSAITPSYRHFVDKNTSPLAAYFQHDSYHMVIASDIHQGESWQFACGLAHLLYANNALGDGQVKPGDRVIIASGEVDASNANIRLVSHLAQKCLQAQKQIMTWQEQRCRIDFLVPEENYRQPLPDVAFELTPISNIADAERLLLEQGLIAAPMVAEQNTHLPSNKLNLGLISNKLANTDLFNKRLFLDVIKSASLDLSKYKKYLKALLSSALLLIVIWLAVNWIINANKSAEIVLSYQQKTLGSCESSTANTLLLSKQDASVISFNAVKLATVCDISIAFKHLEQAPSKVWLVADSYTLIALSATEAEDENVREYSVPIPQWQEESREYFLIAFSSKVDESDKQSLRDYLKSLHQQETSVSLESLIMWTNKQNIAARIIRHHLEK